MNRKMVFSVFALITMFSFNSFAQTSSGGDEIIGKWFSEEKDAKFEIYKENDKYFAKIYWLQDPIDKETGRDRTDIENPDEKKKNRPLKGLVFLTDFEYKGDNLWDHGEIYDPKNGSTYDSYMKLSDDNTLRVRGYIGLSIIGRTTIWSRALK